MAAPLHDPSCRTDVWDPVKYMLLNETGDWFLSLGGEAQLRYENFHRRRLVRAGILSTSR